MNRQSWMISTLGNAVLCAAFLITSGMSQVSFAQVSGEPKKQETSDLFRGDRSSAEETVKQFLTLIEKPDEAMAGSLVAGNAEEKKAGTALLMGVAKMHQATLRLEQAAIAKYGADEVSNSPMFTYTLPRENVSAAFEEVTWQGRGQDLLALIKVREDFFQLPMKHDAGVWRIDTATMGQATGGAVLTGKLFGVLSSVMTEGLKLVESEKNFAEFRHKLDLLTRKQMAPVMAEAMKDAERRKEAQARQFLKDLKIKFTGETKPQSEMAKISRLMSQAYQSANAQGAMELFYTEDVSGETARVFYGTLVKLGGTWDLMIGRVKDKYGDDTVKTIQQWDKVANGVMTFRRLLIETREIKSEGRGFVYSAKGEPLFVLRQTEQGWLVDGQQMAGNLQNLDLELLFIQAVDASYRTMADRVNQIETGDAFVMELQMRTTQQIAPILAEMERRKKRR